MPSEGTIARKPLRVLPGVVVAGLMIVVSWGVPRVAPDAGMVGVLGGLVGTLLILLWWLFFSRVPWLERLGALAVAALGLGIASRLVHPSIATGMMGMLLPLYALPFLSLTLVVWASISGRLPAGARRPALAGALLLVCAAFTLVRTAGISGAGESDFRWRWSPTPEDKLLARAPTTPASNLATTTAPQDRPNWPGFRGPNRDGHVSGLRVETDWEQNPPRELWRQPVGPGWSSFAIEGDRCYTQEQRGDDEVVACYHVLTGQPVWRHRDPARFWESNAGAGPRATPTVSQGRVFTLGATGILNALEAGTGAVAWSRDAVADTDAKVPMWGFAGSPLVLGELVIVATAGRVSAYDARSGAPRWRGPAHRGGYSSPHLGTLGGVEQVLLLSDAGMTSLAPAEGTVLWEYAWPGAAIVQPALTADGDVLAGTGGPTGGLGLRRLSVTPSLGGWSVTERWTSRGLKPYFNDLVVHRGHAYGFDGSLLACVALDTGERRWKGGRYGSGQLLLLPDQDLLLVLAESGDLALVGATPDEFKELTRSPGLKGKTWNHPAASGDVLLVRNSEQMAAFRLPVRRR